jgi:hypothetical protein
MAISRSTTLPPGSSLVWFTVQDEWGNENYTGEYIVVGPSIDYNTGEKEVLAEPVAPSYATAPQPTYTVVYPEPSGNRTINEHIREGLVVQAGDLKRYSTGRVRPQTLSGWTKSENAKGSDDQYATTTSPASGYTPALVASGFNFNVPVGAVITGIKVYVERKKI